MAEMQQRFDQVSALMQDYQVTTATFRTQAALFCRAGVALQLNMSLQNTNINSTREECARLNAKLEVVEQRQGAAAHQISDCVHTQSVHAKQVDRCMEEHQLRLMASVNKAECRAREAAEQIAQQAVSDARASMQVAYCAAPALSA